MFQKKYLQIIAVLLSGTLLIVASYSCTDKCEYNEMGELRGAIEKYSLDFIEDLTASDWAERCKANYGWTDEWITEYQVFRDAFPDLNINVKRILIDSMDVTMWGEVSGTHSKEFPKEELKGHEPQGIKVAWNEVWYYNMVKDSTGLKFGEKMDMVIDGITRMKQLGIKCLPEDEK